MSVILASTCCMLFRRFSRGSAFEDFVDAKRSLRSEAEPGGKFDVLLPRWCKTLLLRPWGEVTAERGRADV